MIQFNQDIINIIENYYYRMIHYEKFKHVVQKINAMYAVEYIDVTNDLLDITYKLVLICKICRSPILRLNEFRATCSIYCE